MTLVMCSCLRNIQQRGSPASPLGCELTSRAATDKLTEISAQFSVVVYKVSKVLEKFRREWENNMEAILPLQ